MNVKTSVAFTAVLATMCLGFSAPAFADEAPPADQAAVVEQSAPATSTDAAPPAENTSTDTQQSSPQEESAPPSEQSPESAPPVEQSVPAPAPAEAAPAPQPEVQPAPAPVQQVAPQTMTANTVTPQGKPGKYQPVWCHLTGNGWKAQLGAKPSGGRNEAFPLMGDFGWGTTKDGQTLAHDRSSKLDAECGKQAPQPEPTKDATASVTAPQAVCVGEDSGQPTFSIAHATWSDIVNTGNGSFSRMATADKGSAFSDGALTKTVTWTIPAPLPSQSTDPYGQCYVPPVPTVTLQASAMSLTCDAHSFNLLWLTNDSDTDVTVTLTQGSKHVNVVVAAGDAAPLSESWLSDNGLGYAPITLSGTADGATVTIEGSTSWTPTDPTTVLPTCSADDFAQFTVEVTPATCTAQGSATAYLNGKTEGIELLDADGNDITAIPQTVGTHSVRGHVPTGWFRVTTDAGPNTGRSDVSDVVTYTIAGATGYQSEDPEAPCYQAPLVRDAVASVSVGDASCTAAGTPTFTIGNATWGDIVTNEDGSFSRVATADKGHAFLDGSATATVNWTPKAQLPSQNTDPNGNCYVKPIVNPGTTTPGTTGGSSSGGSDHGSSVEATNQRLASTGSDLPVGTLVGGAFLLVLGGALVLMRRLRAQKQ